MAQKRLWRYLVTQSMAGLLSRDRGVGSRGRTTPFPTPHSLRPPLVIAFAVGAIGELVAKPAGAAGVAVVPAHRDLVLGTPARVVVVRAGEALGVRRLGRRRRGALLVQRPGLGLTLLLGLLTAALGRLLTGGEVGFAAVQDLLEPGQAHGGPALQLQVVHVPHGQHELHVADLELDVER